MAKLYDVSVTTGVYEVNGEKKYRRTEVGSVWEGKDGKPPYFRMNRTFNPAGVPVSDPTADTIICNMWEPRPRDGQQAAPAPTQRQAAPAAQDFDDDIPF